MKTAKKLKMVVVAFIAFSIGAQAQTNKVSKIELDLKTREAVRAKIDRTYQKIEGMSQADWTAAMEAFASQYKATNDVQRARLMQSLASPAGQRRVVELTRQRIFEQSTNGLVGIIWYMCYESDECDNPKDYPINFWVLTILTLEAEQADNF